MTWTISNRKKSDKMVNIWLSFFILVGLSLGADAQCTAPDPHPTGKTSTTAAGGAVADGSTMTYTCATGYNEDSGSGTATCSGTTLSTPTLVCSGCAAPALDSKMTRTPVTADGAIVAHAGTLVYTCKSGYSATTSVTTSTATCTTNAWVSSATLTCSGAQTNMGFGLSVAVAAIVAHVLTSRV
ncbi:hypothetical protein ScPMuIL_002869 [Solemya velum]